MMEILELLKEIYKSGDCNNCCNNDCQHKPKLGEMVRYNCYDYKPVYKKNDIRETKDVKHNTNIYYTKDEVIAMLKALQEQIRFIAHEEKSIDKEWANGLRYSKTIIQQKIDDLEGIAKDVGRNVHILGINDDLSQDQIDLIEPTKIKALAKIVGYSDSLDPNKRRI